MIKNITYKLFPILISLTLLFPVLKENISSLTIILLCINTILYKIASKDYSLPNAKTFLLTIPFWIIFFWSIFTTNYRNSLVHILHALPFLIIPVFFSLIPIVFFSLQKLNLYITVLKNLCLIIVFIYIISFLNAIPLWKLYYQDGSLFRVYIYSYFDWFVIHPSYYTTILILCFLHALYLLINQKKYFQLIYIFFFYLITFLLLTKLNFVILNISLIISIFINKNIKTIIKTLIGTMGILFAVALIVFTPGFKNRFKEIYQDYNVKPKNLYYNSTNVRRAILDCSVLIAKDNWFKGVGFENLQENLNNCYKSNYNSSFYNNHNYMTHNYYFYILLSTGLLGFLFYLFYLFNIIKISLKSNLFLFKIFVFNTLIICLIEDYFYRQYGIVYFNVMLMIFINYIEFIKLNKSSDEKF